MTSFTVLLQAPQTRTLRLREQYDEAHVLLSELAKRFVGGDKQRVVTAAKLRNELTHPKATPPSISETAVTNALKAILELLNFMLKAIYKRNLPAHNRGLTSKLTA